MVWGEMDDSFEKQRRMKARRRGLNPAVDSECIDEIVVVTIDRLVTSK